MPIKIGIVGCGSIASHLHAPAICSSSEFELVAAIDVDLNSAVNIRNIFAARIACQNLEDAANELDAVILAIPPHLSVQILRTALELGLHVLIEKPLANTISECEEIIGLAKESGKVVAVCHQYRFWPNRIRLEEQFSTGSLAPPESVTCSLGGPYKWNSASGYTVRKNLVPGGVLINAGIHPLDTLISWFGDPVDIEYRDDSYKGLESNVRLEMGFQGGTSCDFRMSRTCTMNNHMLIQGKDYSIRMDYYSAGSYVLASQGGGVENVSVNHQHSGNLGFVVDLYEDFANAIHTGGSPKVDPIEGSRVIRLVERCYKQKRGRIHPDFAPLPGLTW